MKNPFFKKSIISPYPKKKPVSKKSKLAKTIKKYYLIKRHEKLNHLKKYLPNCFLKNEKKDITTLYSEKKKNFNQILGKKDEKIKKLKLLIKGEILLSKKFIINEKNNLYPNCLKKIKKFSDKKKIFCKNICIVKKGFFLGLDEILNNNFIYKYDFKVISNEVVFYEISLDDFLENIFFEENLFFLKKKNEKYSNFIFYSEKKIVDRILKEKNYKISYKKSFHKILRKKDDLKIANKFKKYEFLETTLKYYNSKAVLSKIKKKNNSVNHKKYINYKKDFFNKNFKEKENLKKRENNNKQRFSVKILEQSIKKNKFLENKIILNQKSFNFIDDLRKNYKSYVINSKRKKFEKIKKKKLKKKKLNINIDNFRIQNNSFFKEDKNCKQKVFSFILEKSYKLNSRKSNSNFIIKQMK